MASATVTRTAADRVRALRRQRGWSARELAEACERAGMATLTRSAIAKIESGIRKAITADELTILAQVLEVAPGVLLGTDDEAAEPWDPLESFTTTDLLALLGLVRHRYWPGVSDLYGEVVGPHAPSLRPDATVVDALVTLQALNTRPDGLPQVVAFVENLARRTADPDLAARLREWNRNQADVLGLRPELEAHERSFGQEVEPASEAYLVFRLQLEGAGGERIRLGHWLNTDAQWTPIRGDDFVGSLEQVRDRVAQIIQDTEAGWARYPEVVRLEFVLSTQLINLPVDQWSSDPHVALAAPLGVRYQVVVRSLERMATRRWYRSWVRRWDWLTSPEAYGKVVRAGADDPTSLRRLVSALERSPRWALLVLDREPSSGTDALQAGLRAGIPVVLWNRAHGGEDGFDAVVDQLTKADDIREAVRLLRGEAYGQPNPDDHIGSHLSLLWDDPCRIVIDSPEAPVLSS